MTEPNILFTLGTSLSQHMLKMPTQSMLLTVTNNLLLTKYLLLKSLKFGHLINCLLFKKKKKSWAGVAFSGRVLA
jgi:hypothetical protein